MCRSWVLSRAACDFGADVAMPLAGRQHDLWPNKKAPVARGPSCSLKHTAQADTTLLKALKKPSMSWRDPIEMRDTVGQIGQRAPAISTSWARNAACISFADFVFQSIITKLVWLGPISL